MIQNQCWALYDGEAGEWVVTERDDGPHLIQFGSEMEAEEWQIDHPRYHGCYVKLYDEY